MRTPKIRGTFHIVQEFSDNSVFHLPCDCLTVRIVYHSYLPRLNSAKRLIPAREVDTQDNRPEVIEGGQ